MTKSIIEDRPNRKPVEREMADGFRLNGGLEQESIVNRDGLRTTLKVGGIDSGSYALGFYNAMSVAMTTAHYVGLNAQQKARKKRQRNRIKGWVIVAIGAEGKPCYFEGVDPVHNTASFCPLLFHAKKFSSKEKASNLIDEIDWYPFRGELDVKPVRGDGRVGLVGQYARHDGKA